MAAAAVAVAAVSAGALAAGEDGHCVEVAEHSRRWMEAGAAVGGVVAAAAPWSQ